MSDRNYHNQRRDYNRGNGDGRDGRDSRAGGGGSRDYYRGERSDGGDRGYGNKSRFRPGRTPYSQEQEAKKMDEKFTINYSDLMEKDEIYCSQEALDMKCDEFENFNEDKGGIKDDLYRGIINFGFTHPSKIQSLAIPQIINGRDILAQAQSGSGKTGAFMISSLQLINEDLKKPQVIILSPTCDLAYQTYIVGQALGNYMTKVNFSLTVGGTSRAENIIKLGGTIQGEKDPNPAQIVVATPGRLKDIINDFPNLFDAVKLIIIDECDEMLLGNFSEDIQFILRKLENVEYQMCLFSATLTEETIAIAEHLLNNPIKILIKKEKITLDGIKQTYIPVKKPEEKLSILIEMLQVCSVKKFIVYVNSITNLEAIRDFLESKGFPVLTINSNMSKEQRGRVLLDFKKGQTKCLISTDLLSRGIDIQQLSLVINFDLPHPNKVSNYIHRIGRTGRFGRKGWAINLADERELNTIKSIEVTFRCGIEPFKREHLSSMN